MERKIKPFVKSNGGRKFPEDQDNIIVAPPNLKKEISKYARQVSGLDERQNTEAYRDAQRIDDKNRADEITKQELLPEKSREGNPLGKFFKEKAVDDFFGEPGQGLENKSYSKN